MTAAVEMTKGAMPTADGLRLAAEKRGEPDFLIERRLQALSCFNALPVPERRDEFWRRFPLARLAWSSVVRQGLSLGGGEGEVKFGGQAPQGAYFGALSEAVGTHPELLRKHLCTQVYPAGDAGKTHSRNVPGAGGKFHALNQAFWTNGAFLWLPVSSKAKTLLTLTTRPHQGFGFAPHHLIVLEPGAEAEVLEIWESPKRSVATNDKTVAEAFVCAQTEVVLGEGARLKWMRLIPPETEGGWLDAHRVHLSRGAQFEFAGGFFGGGAVKSFLETILAAPGASARIAGLVFGGENQDLHFDTLQQHAAPGARSDLLFKQLLSGTARVVWRGMIDVAKEAQKTDAYQNCRSIMLSDKARADTIPGLEIRADDVKCSHGATVGEMDPEMLFYLRSRGLDADVARRMMVDGFVEEILRRFGAEDGETSKLVRAALAKKR
jgi:Fe-S cluster assembly protein SufD